ncbi:MAG TPA: glycosyltransferase [Pyrinomonadaceae bacterium]|jgi:processive 1,2-diacylglycerol beta-glucosyltransferase
MFDKVLVLSASAGAGHIRAAQAVERAIAEAGAAREVRHVDTLEYTNKLFRRLYAKAYLDMVNRNPELLGWLYDYLDKPWERERRRLALDKLNTRPFVKMLREYQPDIIVCTHFLPAEIVSWLKAKERITSRQTIVVTDMDVHAMWLCHHYEQYFVAMDETREHMIRLGIPPEKLTVSGIPIDPVFSVEKDKLEMRRKHGLNEEGWTILVSAGGFGVGPIEHLFQSLTELKHEAQAIVVCGRNEELRACMERMAANLPADARVFIKPIGYTTEMDEYMAASDIVLGKPGGLTTSEALARGLVMVIVNPIPGQEERNSDHLLEEGVAIRCNNLPVLAYKIDKLLDDPERFSRMREAARRLARPRAAHEIVSKLLSIERTSHRRDLRG